MRKWIGVICVFLGVLCILGSVGFAVYNRWEVKYAATVSESILKEIQTIIDEKTPDSAVAEMATVKVDNYDCIGILTIPALNLELPVLTDWSYEKLKKAPCHYFGSCYEKNFVIAAHNYKTHFGRLSALKAGDLIVFTDIRGTAHRYEVVLLETLPENATKEMISSEFDLSLYTCTLGGGNRVTVRCNLADR